MEMLARRTLEFYKQILMGDSGGKTRIPIKRLVLRPVFVGFKRKQSGTLLRTGVVTGLVKNLPIICLCFENLSETQ